MSDTSSESKRSLKDFDKVLKDGPYIKKPITETTAYLKKQNQEAIINCVLLDNRKKQLMKYIVSLRVYPMKHPDFDHDRYDSRIEKMEKEYNDIIKEIIKSDFIRIDTEAKLTHKINNIIDGTIHELCKQSRSDSPQDSDSDSESD